MSRLRSHGIRASKCLHLQKLCRTPALSCRSGSQPMARLVAHGSPTRNGGSTTSTRESTCDLAMQRSHMIIVKALSIIAHKLWLQLTTYFSPVAGREQRHIQEDSHRTTRWKVVVSCNVSGRGIL